MLNYLNFLFYTERKINELKLCLSRYLFVTEIIFKSLINLFPSQVELQIFQQTDIYFPFSVYKILIY